MSRDVLEAAPEGQRAGRHLLMWAERGLAPRLIGAISRSDCLRVRAIADGCVRRNGMRRFHPLNVDGWVEQTHFSRSAALFTDRAQVPRTYKTSPCSLVVR